MLLKAQGNNVPKNNSKIKEAYVWDGNNLLFQVISIILKEQTALNSEGHI